MQQNLNENKDVILVDIYNLIYRAYHGNKANLKSPEGIPTNAIFTTIKMLQKIPQQFNMAYCCAIFDGAKVNFRKELDPNYKAHRKPMPEDLRVQLPYIKEAMDILGWPMMQAKEDEADDVIGTMAVRAGAKGFKVYVFSGDKDFRQIISPNITIVDSMQNLWYDEKVLMEKMNLTPKNIVGYLALLGDSVDNVMGIDKVGSDTATKWLNKYGSIEEVIANAQTMKESVAVKNLRQAIASGSLKRDIELVTLRTELPLEFTSKDVKFKPVDEKKWEEFCLKMNFKSFLTPTHTSALK